MVLASISFYYLGGVKLAPREAVWFAAEPRMRTAKGRARHPSAQAFSPVRGFSEPAIAELHA